MHAFLFHPLCWQLWGTLGKAPFPHNRESLNKTSLYWFFFLPCFIPFSLILNLWDPIPKSSTCTQVSVEALLLGSGWWHPAWPLFLILCWIAKASHPGLLVKSVICQHYSHLKPFEHTLNPCPSPSYATSSGLRLHAIITEKSLLIIQGAQTSLSPAGLSLTIAIYFSIAPTILWNALLLIVCGWLNYLLEACLPGLLQRLS